MFTLEDFDNKHFTLNIMTLGRSEVIGDGITASECGYLLAFGVEAGEHGLFPGALALPYNSNGAQSLCPFCCTLPSRLTVDIQLTLHIIRVDYNIITLCSCNIAALSLHTAHEVVMRLEA